MKKLKLILAFFTKAWQELTAVTVTRTYYYNGKKVDKFPLEVEKEFNEAMNHMDEAFKHMREAFK